MPGYVYMICYCINCKALMQCAPSLVPSIRYPPPDGPKEPLCRVCAERMNSILESRGQKRVDIHPDAYSFEPEVSLHDY